MKKQILDNFHIYIIYWLESSYYKRRVKMTNTEISLAFTKIYKWNEVITNSNYMHFVENTFPAFPTVTCICKRYDNESIEQDYLTNYASYLGYNETNYYQVHWMLHIYFGTTVTLDLFKVDEVELNNIALNDIESVSNYIEQEIFSSFSERADLYQNDWRDIICNMFSSLTGCSQDCSKCLLPK